jgi:hypothetical protein
LVRGKSPQQIQDRVRAPASAPSGHPVEAASLRIGTRSIASNHGVVMRHAASGAGLAEEIMSYRNEPRLRRHRYPNENGMMPRATALGVVFVSAVGLGLIVALAASVRSAAAPSVCIAPLESDGGALRSHPG